MSLSTYVLSLARARTQRDRLRVLQQVACDKRFNSDLQAEVRVLIDETQRAPDPRGGSLRPVLNPSEVCSLLVPLRAGEKPVMAPAHEAIFEEWLAGWVEEVRLREANVLPPGPLLLCGPTGCGKTMITGYLASRLQSLRSAVVMEAHKIVNSFLGESSSNLSKAFDAAERNSGMLVIEEIDALAESRTNSGSGADRENNRISVGMMRMIEGSSAPIIATTNRAEVLDTALLRRFEYKIQFPLPDESMRRSVLLQRFGPDVPQALVDMPLTESIPYVSRIRRLMALRNLSAVDALAALKAA